MKIPIATENASSSVREPSGRSAHQNSAVPNVLTAAGCQRFSLTKSGYDGAERMCAATCAR